MNEQVYTSRFAAKRFVTRQASPAEWEVIALGDKKFGVKPVAPVRAVEPPKAANPTRAAEIERIKAKRPKKAQAAPALGKRAQAQADAEAGKLPAIPDFSAETHRRFRPKLDELVKMVKAGDVKALKAFAINPISTSPKAVDRYRNLAVIALTAKAERKEAA